MFPHSSLRLQSFRGNGSLPLSITRLRFFGAHFCTNDPKRKALSRIGHAVLQVVLVLLSTHIMSPSVRASSNQDTGVQMFVSIDKLRTMHSSFSSPLYYFQSTKAVDMTILLHAGLYTSIST